MRLPLKLVLLVLSATAAAAQLGPAVPQYTIRSQTRIVLTDVTVTDRDGKPVHGLKASDFHILDNRKPQKLASFEEHTPEATAPIAHAVKAGAYSNDYITQLPPAVNVLLLDTAWMPVQMQMDLNAELRHFLDRLGAKEPGQPLAIYLKRGDSCVLLQDFTTDRALLDAALHQGIPLLHALGTEYPTPNRDLLTLHEMALALSTVPGRKNLLWFSPGLTLPVVADVRVLPSNEEMRPTYDELEAYRISLYLMDVRGLTLRGGSSLRKQYDLEDELSEATGGRAFYGGNDIATATERVVDQDRNFYTLTYSPTDFKNDNSWHKIDIEVDGKGYTLSYRRGYFADGFDRGAQSPDADTAKTRTRLLANGNSLKIEGLTSAPLLFEASVEADTTPATAASLAPTGKAVLRASRERLSVAYSVPASSLLIREVDGHSQVVLGAAAFIVNLQGRVLSQRTDQFTILVDPEKLRLAPQANLHIEQKIDAANGDNFLYLSVWDTVTHRQGRIQVPLKVPLKVQSKQSSE
jgi:VWFA-related protein